VLPDLAASEAIGALLPEYHVEPRAQQALQAVYFDTADLRLARWGVTLRHRRGEAGGDGWTVKFPQSTSGAVLARREVYVAGRAGRVPRDVANKVTALVRNVPLEAVAKLVTLRRGILLIDQHGDVVVDVVDDEVSVYEGRRLISRFREIEVELGPGADPRILETVVAILVEAGASPTDPIPKIVRALGVRADEPPDVVARRIPKKASVAALVANAFNSAALSLVQCDPAIRLGDHIEDVHQARVATRTLRSNLGTFRTILDPTRYALLRDEVAWLGRALGAVREADVLHDRLRQLLARLSAGDAERGSALLDLLGQGRAAARAELLKSMESSRYVTLVDSLIAAADQPPLAPIVCHEPGEAADHQAMSAEKVTGDVIAGDQPARDKAAALVVGPWRCLERAVKRLGDDPPDESLHRLRIKAKRCRYAAEAVADVAGRPAVKLAKAVARLQTVLGEHQDAVVAETWLRAEAARGTIDPLVAGQLVMLQRIEAQTKRDQWKSVWKDVRSSNLSGWLD